VRRRLSVSKLNAADPYVVVAGHLWCRRQLNTDHRVAASSSVQVPLTLCIKIMTEPTVCWVSMAMRKWLWRPAQLASTGVVYGVPDPGVTGWPLPGVSA
jgi:hypothetical protein